MRVLHVLEAAGTGVGLYVATVAELQQLSGHQVAVAMPDRRAWGITNPALIPSLKDAGVKVESTPIHTFPLHVRNLGAVRRLARFARLWAPDVIHSHSLPAGIIARPVGRRLGIATVHTPNGVRFADERLRASSAAELAIEKLMAPLTDRVIAVSPSEAAVLARAYLPDRVSIVHNAIPAPDQVPEMPSRPRVVAVNRFVYQKNPEAVVRIMARARRLRPELEAAILGDGVLNSQVLALVRSLDPGIEVERSDVGGKAAIARSSMLLLSSRWEGAPFVLLEAMGLARPIVASDVVGTKDVVRNGETGFLYPADDETAASDFLVRLVDDPSTAAKMGIAGRSLLRAQYAPDQMIDGLDRTYEEARIMSDSRRKR